MLVASAVCIGMPRESSLGLGDIFNRVVDTSSIEEEIFVECHYFLQCSLRLSRLLMSWLSFLILVFVLLDVNIRRLRFSLFEGRLVLAVAKPRCVFMTIQMVPLSSTRL